RRSKGGGEPLARALPHTRRARAVELRGRQGPLRAPHRPDACHAMRAARAARTAATASAASRVIPFQLPSARRRGATIQLPPTARTAGRSRYPDRRDGVIEPVGRNRMPRMGADTALRYAAPPALSAGKTFWTANPASWAAFISVGVSTPGT